MQRGRQFRVWDLQHECFVPLRPGLTISMTGTIVIDGGQHDQSRYQRYFEITERLGRDLKDSTEVNIYEGDLLVADSATTTAENYTKSWDHALLEVYYQDSQARFWLRNYLTGEIVTSPPAWDQLTIVSNVYEMGVQRRADHAKQRKQ